jgi:hypothetical protein
MAVWGNPRSNPFVLLYVGAALSTNGIWLIGLARVANREKVTGDVVNRGGGWA